MTVRINFKVVKNDFVKQLKQEIEGYNFEVGILEDKPHKKASFVRSANVFAGQEFKTLKQDKKTDARTTGEIAKGLNDKYQKKLFRNIWNVIMLKINQYHKHKQTQQHEH